MKKTLFQSSISNVSSWCWAGQDIYTTPLLQRLRDYLEGGDRNAVWPQVKRTGVKWCLLNMAGLYTQNLTEAVVACNTCAKSVQLTIYFGGGSLWASHPSLRSYWELLGVEEPIFSKGVAPGSLNMFHVSVDGFTVMNMWAVYSGLGGMCICIYMNTHIYIYAHAHTYVYMHIL